ncbi:MAG: pseudouridine-5'-phosphate glycosidase [Acidimicrobiia bacterium]
MTAPTHLHISDPVAAALADGSGVVALESTIVTHGMPYPQNVETALAVEAAVEARGAVPATIAAVDGVLRVGLDRDELDALAQAGEEAVKVSRRDLGFVVARGAVGGTTVAATMIIAAAAGIDVFATGGIGGVHRGAPATLDISADLQELARTDVVVVSAGFKSILDLGLTLEYLETYGVPVVGFGTDILPAFYTRDSEFAVDYRIDTAAEVARVMRVRRELGVGGGMVIANPIPAEHSMDSAVIDAAIERAVGEAEAQGISGKEITPFLLARIVELTGSASLDANIELVLNNARLAADIALEQGK